MIRIKNLWNRPVLEGFLVEVTGCFQLLIHTTNKSHVYIWENVLIYVKICVIIIQSFSLLTKDVNAMYKEIKYGIWTEYQIQAMISSNDIVAFKGKHPMLVGKKVMLKVNTNIGVSSKEIYDQELFKLDTLSNLSYRPDSMMDHTITNDLPSAFWKRMVETFDGPIGTLPHYLPYDSKKGIDKSAFWDNFLEMCEGGVGFMTLHPTASISLLELAKKCRRTPTTSRGGAILLSDAIINNRTDNLIADNFDEILSTMRKNRVAISIGSVFRPATVVDALDEVHVRETQLQKAYIDIAKNHQVNVIMEGIGHITLDSLKKYLEIINGFKTPLMPLGPIPSDNIIGFDHVSAAIGASHAASMGNVGIINSLTREEHTGGVPSIESIIEGLMASRTVAHCINIARFPRLLDIEKATSENRAKKRTCVMSGGIFDYKSDTSPDTVGCSRCSRECPLAMKEW